VDQVKIRHADTGGDNMSTEKRLQVRNAPLLADLMA